MPHRPPPRGGDPRDPQHDTVIWVSAQASPQAFRLITIRKRACDNSRQSAVGGGRGHDARQGARPNALRTETVPLSQSEKSADARWLILRERQVGVPHVVAWVVPGRWRMLDTVAVLHHLPETDPTTPTPW